MEEAGEVIYTYDVEWRQSDVTWSHRWDVYFTGNPDDEIHYFSIVNSLMIVLFLTGTIGQEGRGVGKGADRRVCVWCRCGGHDHAADPATRHLQLQRDADPGTPRPTLPSHILVPSVF